MRKDVSAGLLAACFVASPLAPALAQHCYSGWTAAYSCMEGCGGCPASGGSRRGWSPPPGPSPDEIARQQRVAASREYNDQGIAAYGRSDWAEAVRLFRLSLDDDPGDSVIAHNLSRAQDKLSEAQQSVVAAGKIHSLVEGYAQSVAPMTSSGGLDFDQSSSASRPPGGLEFMTTSAGPAAKPAAGDCGSAPDFGPSVVNACHVPSGLPKIVDEAITSGYSGAPPGVSDRVRKGFQAVAAHDWNAARAWFEDALNHDPQNAGLKRLTELADFTLTRTQRKRVAKTSSASGALQLPESSDMQFLFRDDERKPARSGAALPLPKESDVEFLFPGLPALEAKELSDYTEKYWITRIETDPQLIRAGRNSLRKSSASHVTK